MRIRALILLLLNMTILVSGQDSLKFRNSIYYPDGKKYTGTARNFDQLNEEFEEKGRVWLYTLPDDTAAQPTVIAFKLFTNIPLWIYTTSDSSEINRLLKSVRPEEMMTTSNLESELKKYIKQGTLSDIFILQTLGQPDKLKYYDEENRKVSQWTYKRLNLYLIFTNRIVTNYINMNNYR